MTKTKLIENIKLSIAFQPNWNMNKINELHLEKMSEEELKAKLTEVRSELFF